ncbi:S1 family peptidase [Saccharothrix obliqua]|uniref:S1 family peptidase n=1 Tax=Saccharothrix obliqua TaxID=2861747 RepID=UPI001C5E9151|nr:trypsin-like serine protease [Saccharothrix obliqua]MBW4720632.1 trypsin-like serine protease [Saccharothrix obliqua]
MTRVLLVLLLLVAPVATAGPASAVVGGHQATRPYPFIASLQANGAHFCAGSLIRPDWVVTAKHCVAGRAPAAIGLRVGSTDRTTGGTLTQAVRSVVHPTADLALLRLRAPVTHPPVAVAPPTPAPGPRPPLFRLLGWGLTCEGCTPPPVVLHEVDAARATNPACGAGEECLGGNGRGACRGDDGGPALIESGGTWLLAGVASRAVTTACREGTWAYVGTAAHRTWIANVVGG